MLCSAVATSANDSPGIHPRSTAFVATRCRATTAADTSITIATAIDNSLVTGKPPPHLDLHQYLTLLEHLSQACPLDHPEHLLRIKTSLDVVVSSSCEATYHYSESRRN